MNSISDAANIGGRHPFSSSVNIIHLYQIRSVLLYKKIVNITALSANSITKYYMSYTTFVYVIFHYQSKRVQIHPIVI